MDRRIFLKQTGISLGCLFLSSLLSNCTTLSLEDLSIESDDSEEKIRDFITRSNFGFYENNKSVFRQNRALLIINGYRFIDDKPFCQKENLDFLVEFEVLALCKFNYDFYKYHHEIIGSYQVTDDSTYFVTDNPSYEICYIPFPCVKTIMYPIKITSKSNNKIELDPRYALPCVMTKEAFQNYWKAKDVINHFNM